MTTLQTAPDRDWRSRSRPSVGVGYVPFAPGTFGSAAGLLRLVVLPGVRRSRRPPRSSAMFVAGVVERQRRASGISAAPIPVTS